MGSRLHYLGFMKNLNLKLAQIVFWAAGVTIFLTTSRGFSASPLCENFYTEICGKNGESSLLREQQIESLVKPIREKAVLDAAESTNFDGIFDSEPITFATLKKLKKIKVFGKTNAEKNAYRKKKTKLMRAYFESLSNQVADLVKNLLESRNIDSAQLTEAFQFPRAVGLVKAAVEKSKLTEPQKNKVYEKLEKLELVSIWDLLNKDNATIDHGLRSAYIDSCGYSGLSDNAFAHEYFKGDQTREKGPKKYVIVPCLSAFIAAINPIYYSGPNEDLVLATQVWTLGHEIGHHFDGTSKERGFNGKIVYKKMYQCLERNYAKDLLPDLDRAKKLGRDLKPIEVVTDHIGEISADYWGNEVMGLYLNEVRDLETRKSIVKENMFGLCISHDDPSNGDEGIHPGAKFRISMTKRTKSVMQALGCSVLQEPACGP